MKLAGLYRNAIHRYRIASGGERTARLRELRKLNLRALRADIRRTRKAGAR